MVFVGVSRGFALSFFRVAALCCGHVYAMLLRFTSSDPVRPECATACTRLHASPVWCAQHDYFGCETALFQTPAYSGVVPICGHGQDVVETFRVDQRVCQTSRQASLSQSTLAGTYTRMWVVKRRAKGVYCRTDGMAHHQATRCTVLVGDSALSICTQLHFVTSFCGHPRGLDSLHFGRSRPFVGGLAVSKSRF